MTRTGLAARAAACLSDLLPSGVTIRPRRCGCQGLVESGTSHIVWLPRMWRRHPNVAENAVELHVRLWRRHLRHPAAIGNPLTNDGRFAHESEEVHHLAVDGSEDLIGEANARHHRCQSVAAYLDTQRQHVPPETPVVAPTFRRCRRTTAKDVTVDDKQFGASAQMVTDRRLSRGSRSGDHEKRSVGLHGRSITWLLAIRISPDPVNAVRQ